MKKKISGLTVLLLCLFFVNPAFSELDETLVGIEHELIKEQNEMLKRYFIVDPEKQIDGVEITAKPMKETYSTNEQIKIDYTLTNNSKESRYYWASAIGVEKIMIWYQNKLGLNFLYSTQEPFVIFSGNLPMELKPGESYRGAVTLDPKNYPQIYQQLEIFPSVRIYACIINDALYPKHEPLGKTPGLFPAGEKIIAKSNMVIIEIMK